MFFWRREVRPGWSVAFTDLEAGSMSVTVPADSTARQGRLAVREALGLETEFQFMNQVHGSVIAEISDHAPQPEADGIVSTSVPLAVLVADCLPVLLLAETPDGVGLSAAVHAGRAGVRANIIAKAVQSMENAGAQNIDAWIGPAICGRCYEVPEHMRAEVSALVPAAFGVTSWGTPSLDLRAGATAQLIERGASVHQVAYCTLEEPRLFSHRSGAPIGRFAGLVYRSKPGRETK